MSEAQAQQVLARHFAVTDRATSLGGQQDRNFIMADDDGAVVGVLKIANPAFSVTELQARDVAAESIADTETALHRCTAT